MFKNLGTFKLILWTVIHFIFYVRRHSLCFEPMSGFVYLDYYTNAANLNRSSTLCLTPRSWPCDNSLRPWRWAKERKNKEKGTLRLEGLNVCQMYFCVLCEKWIKKNHYKCVCVWIHLHSNLSFASVRPTRVLTSLIVLWMCCCVGGSTHPGNLSSLLVERLQDLPSSPPLPTGYSSIHSSISPSPECWLINLNANFLSLL